MPHILLHSFSSSLFSEGGTLSFWEAVFCTVGTYLGAEALSSDVLAEAPAAFEVTVSPAVLMGVPTALDGDAAPAVFEGAPATVSPVNPAARVTEEDSLDWILGIFALRQAISAFKAAFSSCVSIAT